MKHIVVLLKHGVEEVEALTVVDFLRRSDIDVTMLSCESTLEIEGGHEITFFADDYLSSGLTQYDGIYIPGGLLGAEALAKDETVLALIRKAHEEGKLIAAMCAGPLVLEKAGILEGRRICCYPGMEQRTGSAKEHSEELTQRDGNIYTSRGPATAIYLAMELVEALCGTEERKNLEEKILLRLVRDSVCN